jgi:group I intron endonuclease
MKGIYKITSPSDRVYIGQSIDIERRFRHYKRMICKEQIKIYNSLLKYGVDAHIFEVLELCDTEELNNRERHYQDLYDSVANGLNLLYVKSEHFNGGHSEESKKKISDSLKGRKLSEEHKYKIGLNNSRRGMSDETKEKHRLGRLGKKASPETIAKQILKRLGTKRSEETKKKISEALKGIQREPISEETRNIRIKSIINGRRCGCITDSG